MVIIIKNILKIILKSQYHSKGGGLKIILKPQLVTVILSKIVKPQSMTVVLKKIVKPTFVTVIFIIFLKPQLLTVVLWLL